MKQLTQNELKEFKKLKQWCVDCPIEAAMKIEDLNRENQRYKEKLQQMEESNIQMCEQQQKLRKDIKDWYELAYQLKDENQRYKEVLEFYADELTYTDKQYTSSGQLVGTGYSNIISDCGEKARQALRGE